MTNSADLISKIDQVRTNPLAITKVILDAVEAASAGEQRVVDPSNSWVMLLESAIVTSSASIMQAEALTRRQYTTVSQTEDELYLHMSDVDYANRFSTPSRTSYYILMGKDELYAKAVSTGVGRVRKLVIPRNTQFSVAGYKFSMQYPIELRIMSHGGLQIVYDVTTPSPLQALESNIVAWALVEINGIEYIQMEIPVSQFSIKTEYPKISNTGGFTQNVLYEDNFYYCRVYIARTDGTWKEIKTTHTDQVYDPFTPTAVLKVYLGQVNVHIPPIYFTTGQITTELRIDVYTTKGPVDLILSNYEVNAHTAKWIDLEGEDDGIYTAPLSTFSTMAVYSDKTVTGGTLPVTFEQLRQLVMTNSLGSPVLPITNAQIDTVLSRRGYKVLKNIDIITNRIFLATRGLPLPPNSATVAPTGCLMGMFQSSIEELAMVPTTSPNGNRLTILPTTLYHQRGGVIQVVSQTELSDLYALNAESFVNAVNSGSYLYTPFHYVFDTNASVFACRGYYLDSPKVESKVFVAENDTAVLEISTRSYVLERTAEGYRLQIITRSGDSFKALPDESIQVQLSYTAKRESSRAYMVGTFLGTDAETNERLYEFNITTDYDINELDEIFLTSFKMFDVVTERELPSDLLSGFDITYVVVNYTVTGMQGSELDQSVATYLLPDEYENYVAVIRERLLIRLGYPLKELWSKSRSVISSIEYERYLVDVPYLYEADVFERDGNGHIVMVPDGNGGIAFNRLHRAGDPVLDVDGNPVIKHVAGELKRDAEGEPIPKSTRGMLRQVELLFIDGRYFFANKPDTVSYRNSIPMTVVDWLRDDIAPYQKVMLEKTELYFYPQATLGNITVLSEGGESLRIPAEQQFNVQVYVSQQVYDNGVLKIELANSMTRVIADILTRSMVSILDINAELKAALGDDVYGVLVSGLGGSRNINTMTITDESQRAVIRKRLAIDGDGALIIQDDFNVNFSIHNAPV